jgi:DNA-binding response OmpR family regulator
MGRLAFIIEDNQELGLIYAASIEIFDYEAEIIGDGKKALERLAETVPSLIILDMNLPHVSGHFIYKRLRSDALFNGCPIIIATANALIADALKNELTPGDHLLVKPISPTQLRNLVKTVAQRTP